MATATASAHTKADLKAAAELLCPFWGELTETEQTHAIRDMAKAYAGDELEPEAYWEGFTAEDKADYLASIPDAGVSRESAEVKPAKKPGRKATGETRDTLIAKLKLRGLKGYSGLNKSQLEEYVKTGIKPIVVPKPGTAAALKAQCRDEKLKGYSKLKKAELVTYIETKVRPVPAVKEGTVDYYRDLLKKHDVAGRSKAKNKADMIALCKANGIKGVGL